MRNNPESVIDQTYKSIKTVLEKARSKSFKAVNTIMVRAYWSIGKIIVEEEQQGRAKAGYGEYLIKELSERLTNEFGKGFDKRNLWFMRSFYLSFEIVNAVRSQFISQEKSDAVRHVSAPKQKNHALLDELPVIRSELSWTHYRLLLKIEKPEAREFYIKETINNNRSMPEGQKAYRRG